MSGNRDEPAFADNQAGEYPTEDGVVDNNQQQQNNEPEEEPAAAPVRDFASNHDSENGARDPEDIPPPPKEKKQLDSSLKPICLVYLILSFISFAFLLTSACPVPWFRGKGAYKGVQWNTWRRKGGNLPVETLGAITGCAKEKHFRQVIATCAVLAMAFSLFNLISIIRVLFGKGSLAMSLVWGFLTIIWSIGGWAMAAALYNDQRCAKETMKSISHLDAGFALTLIAWVLMCAAVIIVWVSTRNAYGPPPHAPPMRMMTLVFFIIILISLLFLCVGCAFSLWKRSFPKGNLRAVRHVKVSSWHIEVIDEHGYSTYFGHARYRCSAYQKRIKATQSFTILAIVTLFFAGVFTIVSFLKPVMRIPANIFTILTIIFLFIAWVTAVAVRYRTLCTGSLQYSYFENYPGIPSGIEKGHLKFTGYAIAEGLGLVIAAWCILIVGVVCNFVIGEPGSEQATKEETTHLNQATNEEEDSHNDDEEMRNVSNDGEYPVEDENGRVRN